jgi:hypothetical protein
MCEPLVSVEGHGFCATCWARMAWLGPGGTSLKLYITRKQHDTIWHYLAYDSKDHIFPSLTSGGRAKVHTARAPRRQLIQGPGLKTGTRRCPTPAAHANRWSSSSSPNPNRKLCPPSNHLSLRCPSCLPLSLRSAPTAQSFSTASP